MLTGAVTRYHSVDTYIRSKVDRFLAWYEDHDQLAAKNRQLPPRVFVFWLMVFLVIGFTFVAIVAQTNQGWADIDKTQLKLSLITGYILVTFIGMWSHWWPLSAASAVCVFLIATLSIGYSMKYGEYEAGIQMIGAIVFYLVLLFIVGLVNPRSWTRESLMYVLPFATVVVYQILPENFPELPIRISKLEGADWIFVGLTNTAIARGILKPLKKWILTPDKLFDIPNFIAGQYFELLLRKIYPVRISLSEERKRKRDEEICPCCGK